MRMLDYRELGEVVGGRIDDVIVEASRYKSRWAIEFGGGGGGDNSRGSSDAAKEAEGNRAEDPRADV